MAAARPASPSPKPHNPMTYFGGLLIVAGIALLITSLGMETSVRTEAGELVHNMALAQEQTERLALGAVALVGGIILIAAGAAKRATPPRASSSTSIAGELERLAALRASGALTPAEFEAAKRELLGRRT